MEALLGLLLIPLGIALILSPILAWVAMFRTGRLGRELEKLQKTNKILSSLIDRLETRLTNAQAQIAALQGEVAQARTETVQAPPALEGPVEVTPTQIESPTPAEIADLPETTLPVRAEEEDIGEAPDAASEGAPDAIEAQIPEPKVAAARAEAPDDAVLREAGEGSIAPPGDAEIRKLPPPPVRSDATGEVPSQDDTSRATAREVAEPEVPEHRPGPWDHVARAQPSKAAAPGPIPLPEPRRKKRSWAGSAITSLAQSLGAGEGDWETRIGQNWLNIIGIIILVVGLVLLIQQSLLMVSPLGKIAIGAAVASVLMVTGTFLQRRERYRVFAYTLIGGGWGLFYFTAFAAYNVEAAKIIDNEYVAMVVLLAVAAGIIAQSFRYSRQSVTALAYGLAFLALHLSPLSFYSLIATAVLAATIPFVVRRTDWRQLGVIIAVTTYATHARWLWATQLAADDEASALVLGGLQAPQAFWGNIGVLALYWVVFCATAIAHKPGNERARSLDLATSLINTVGLVGLVAWQLETYLPGNLHYIAPPAIIAYVATAIVDGRMERPVLSGFNGSIATILFTVAMPAAIYAEGWAWDWLSPYWALGALMIWAIARRLDTELYRFHSYALTGLSVLASVIVNLEPTTSAQGWLFLRLGLSPIVPAALMIEALSKDRDLGSREPELTIRLAAILVAPVLVGLALWSSLPDHLAGLGMLTLGFFLLEAGIWSGRQYLRSQGYILGAAGLVLVLMLVAVDPPSDQLQLARRVLVAAAIVGYAAGLRLRFASGCMVAEQRLAWIAPAFATVFVAAALYHWWPIEAASLGWAVWAALMFELGRRLGWIEIRLQSYLLAATAFLVILILAALDPSAERIQLARLVLLGSAVIGYVAGLRMKYAGALENAERGLSWAGPTFATVFFAAALFHWAPIEATPIGWAVWALVLLEVGLRLRWLEVRVLAYALATAAAGLCAALQDTIWVATPGASPWQYTALVALLLHVLAWRIAFPGTELAKPEGRLSVSSLVAGGGLYAAATWAFLPGPLVAFSWMVWGFAINEVGRRIKREGVSLSALSMGAISFAFTLLANVYDIVPLEPASRAIQWVGFAGVVTGLYALHARGGKVPGSPTVLRVSEGGAFLHLGTVLFATVLWHELPSVAVAVAWGALAFILIELSERVEKSALIRQSQVLLLAAVVRLFFANFVIFGETFGLSHRVVTVGAIIAIVYYMRALLNGGWGGGLRLVPAPVFSWIGAGLLVVLARFEVGREFAVAIWSLLILVFVLLGTRLPDVDFRHQAYLLCLLVFGRAWATNAYLEGTLWGISERIVTTVPSLAALLIVVWIIPRGFRTAVPDGTDSSLARVFAYADRHARSVIALLFAVQLTLLILYEMSADLVSIGWALAALFLLLVGFVLNERTMRLYGLALLLVCLFKVVFFDLVGVETIYRVFSFIVLGLVLLLASLGYSRFRDALGRYL